MNTYKVDFMKGKTIIRSFEVITDSSLKALQFAVKEAGYRELKIEIKQVNKK